MTESTISLISIACGILAANVLGYIAKKFSFGLIGNSIAGVFGSIFFIKIVGRLGFDPTAIMQSGDFNLKLFIINLVVSVAGGMLALLLAKLLKNRMDSA